MQPCGQPVVRLPDGATPLSLCFAGSNTCAHRLLSRSEVCRLRKIINPVVVAVSITHKDARPTTGPTGEMSPMCTHKRCRVHIGHAKNQLLQRNVASGILWCLAGSVHFSA